MGTGTLVATASDTFTASDRFNGTAWLDWSGFLPTGIRTTAQQNSSGSGTVLGTTWVVIAAGAVLAVAIVAALWIAKCVRPRKDSGGPESNETMLTEEGTTFNTLTQDLLGACYENPNELEGMDSDGLATEIVDSDPALLDELL
jgi:hypothetical protein